MTSRHLLGAFVVIGLTLTAFQNCSGDLPDNIKDESSKGNPSGSQLPAGSPLSSPASCTAQAVSNCNLPAQASGGIGGACAAKYSGTCSFQCTNGAWTPVSNTCALIDPMSICKGTFTWDIPNNASGTFTIDTLNADGSFSGTCNLGGIYSADPIIGTCSVTAAGGHMSFTRYHGQAAQVFTGDWTSADNIHASITNGVWYWLGAAQGPWTATK